MYLLLVIAIIVVALLTSDKMKTLKRELDMHRHMIFQLRDKIEKLEKAMTDKTETAPLEKEIVEIEPKKADILPDETEVKLASVVPTVVGTKPVIHQEMPQEEPAKAVLFKRPLMTENLPPLMKKQPMFNAENWVGVNLLNRLGVLMILIGAIATATLDAVPNVLRSAILLAVAMGVLVGGELMNRKKSTVASMGVTALGVALSYVWVATSFFALGVFSMYAALGSTIVVTAIGLFLAKRYDEEVIACFALVGGYFPIFALDSTNDALVLGLVIYFSILVLYTLILSTSKIWQMTNYIGLGLTLGSIAFLGLTATPHIAMIYGIFAFIIYTIIPIIITIKTNKPMSQANIILILTNGFISTSFIFIIATEVNMAYIHTILSLLFIAIYTVLAKVTHQRFQQSYLTIIFTLKAIAFAVLFVPFTFDYQAFAILWTLEAMVLLIYGTLKHQKWGQYTGLVVKGLALFTLFVSFIHQTDQQFTLDHAVFTLATLITLVAFIYKKAQFVGIGSIYKNITLVNLPLFIALFLTDHTNWGTWGIYTRLTISVLCFGLSVIYIKLPAIADKNTRIIATIIHGICLILTFYDMELSAPWRRGADYLAFTLAFLVAIGAVGMVIYDHMSDTSSKGKTVYKNITLTSLLPFSLLFIEAILHRFEERTLLMLLTTFLLGRLIKKGLPSKDKWQIIIGCSFQSIGIIWLLTYNMLPFKTGWIFIGLSAIVQLVAIYNLNDLLKQMKTSNSTNNPYKNLILACYFLFVVTQNIIVQTTVAMTDAFISILFAVTAFLWIIIAFYLKNSALRKGGLYLALLTGVKLIILLIADIFTGIWGLTTLMRIVSFVSVGIVLMAISFAYQKFNIKR